MKRGLFLCLVEAICAFDLWFIQKQDALGRLDLSSLQKCYTTFQILTYGIPAYLCDEYVRLNESIALEAMNYDKCTLDCDKILF